MLQPYRLLGVVLLVALYLLYLAIDLYYIAT
jgi:hypothetical protein